MAPKKQEIFRCNLCERQFESASSLTEHHLLPKSEGGTIEHVTPLCRLCHSTVHATFSNRTLATLYSTLDALKAAPELQSYLKWVRRQDPERRFRARRRNERR